MKCTLDWRGKEYLGDERDPLTWKWLGLDEFLLDLVGEALHLDGNPSSFLGRKSSWREVEMRREERRKNARREEKE